MTSSFVTDTISCHHFQLHLFIVKHTDFTQLRLRSGLLILLMCVVFNVSTWGFHTVVCDGGGWSAWQWSCYMSRGVTRTQDGITVIDVMCCLWRSLYLPCCCLSDTGAVTNTSLHCCYVTPCHEHFVTRYIHRHKSPQWTPRVVNMMWWAFLDDCVWGLGIGWFQLTH